MSTPTIEEITAAAKASAQSTPRPSRAFWIEAIRSYIEQNNVKPGALMAVSLTHGLTSTLAHNDELRAAIMAHTNTLTEAALRALFIELLVTGAGVEHAARARWGAVFGLCEEAHAGSLPVCSHLSIREQCPECIRAGVRRAATDHGEP